jgi:urocanate hydratase
MMWDVMGGVARRSWARCKNSIEVAMDHNSKYQSDHITLPYVADDELVRKVVDEKMP